MRPYILLLALMMMGGIARADLKDLPVKQIDGVSYYYYDVQPKETVYSICRRLKITKEQLLSSNQSVGQEGLKAGDTLLFPVGETDENTTVAQRTTHLVKKGETIYGISRNYGVTPSQLAEWNPGIRDGIRAGMTLYVNAPVSDKVATAFATNVSAKEGAATTPASKSDENIYVVKKGETFYSVAHSHGLSVAQLEEANPGIGILKEGQRLVIPTEGASERQRLSSVKEETALAETPAADAKRVNDVNIAVMLPFMLEEENRGRQAQLYTEFYKGFLLAVDSLRDSRRPIHIYTYDTAGSNDTVRSILGREEMKDMQVIIGPDNEQQLDLIAGFADKNNASVLNLFAVRDQSYLRNPSMLQATIPHEAMYQKAVEAMAEDMEGRQVVVLQPSEGSGDKTEFVEMLTKALGRRGGQVSVIEYGTTLDISELSGLDPNEKYSFITTTSRQPELNRVLPALIELKQTLTEVDPLRLYGYPEWTTFRGETLKNMHQVNTYVYSRFFTVPDDPWAEKVEQRFTASYGEPMGQYVPRQGLLGFDTGLFLLRWLENADNLNDALQSISSYNGVQNGFHFIIPQGASGMVNDDLYFVNFRPSGLIDRIAL